jgi:farnesyl-diphosphate farnesyltransferase
LTTSETEFCDLALGEVSRTFALSIRRLPGELREAIRTAYLLCRMVDTVEDDRGLGATARCDLFDAFESALSHATEGDLRPAVEFERRAIGAAVGCGWERTLCTRGELVFRAFSLLTDAQKDAISRRILQMSAGMREYAARADANGGLRIRDVADLERYCHYVAGTVGEFLTDLFAIACPIDRIVRLELDARASRFGIGLQLVNILKDVAEDHERGDCFLPLASAEEHGVSLDDILASGAREEALALCRFLCREAREHLRAAEEYTLFWPHEGLGRDARAFCAGPLALALGTLQRVELGPETLRVRAAPSVSREFVVGVFTEIDQAVQETDSRHSDAILRGVFERARVGIAGRPSRPPVPPAAFARRSAFGAARDDVRGVRMNEGFVR